MKLATIKSQDKNGKLIVVSRNNKKAVDPGPLAPNLLYAVEHWKTVRNDLTSLYNQLNEGTLAGSFNLNLADCIAPLPHAPGFYDGSAFLSHVERARGSRGDKMPESARITPLMYQGVSDNLLPYNAPIELMDMGFGGDFEGEFAVITDFVPRATKAEDMEEHLILFSFFNDITYRELLKPEIETKFGFLQSKPNSSFAPFVVTPDEFGSAWMNGRIDLDVEVKLNGELFGKPNGREMNFSFHELVAHACRTRPLAAGNIIGTGTVSNKDKQKGFACLTEARYQEVIDTGKASTPWLNPGDQLFMDVQQFDVSVFGPIDEKVVL